MQDEMDELRHRMEEMAQVLAAVLGAPRRRGCSPPTRPVRSISVEREHGDPCYATGAAESRAADRGMP